MKRFIQLAAALAVALSGATAQSQDKYPSQPIRMVVPAPAGGYYDKVARVLGQYLSQSLGQPVVIDNKGGANGVIGATQVARSAPDGYTLMMGGTGPNAIAPSLKSNLPYDPSKDFAPIALVTSSPNILVVTSKSPIRSTQEFVAAARSRSDSMLYAHNAVGTSTHLAMEQFRLAIGGKLEGVAYAGSAPALVALTAGQVEVAFATALDVLPLIQAGRIRPLGIASKARLGALPDVPRLADGGVAGVESAAWSGVLAPAGTPQAIIGRLNSEINKALRDPEVRSKLSPAGELELLGGTPDQFRDFIDAEIKRWSHVVKAGGIRTD
jgi:tripartite-type tricarboxylate transporter receptor subunit TctC